MRTLTAVRVLAAVLAVSAPPAFADTSPKKLKFAGCSISSVAYMKDMAVAYKKRYGVPVEVSGGGVPVGIRATMANEVELGGSCRHLLPGEIEKGAVSTVVGYDMLVFIAHPENPVDALTMDEIRGVFSGKIKRWDEVGGPSRDIAIVGREVPDAGVAVMFKEKVMGDIPITENRVNLQSTSDIEKEMETNRWGIAVTGISSAALRKVKLLAIHKAKPSRDTFLDGSYPLARPLYLVTNGKPAGETKKFIDFVLSADGQKVMGQNAFSLKEYCQRQKAMTGVCDLESKAFKRATR